MTTEPRDTAIRRLKRRAVFSLVSGPVCALCFVVYLAYPGMAFQRDAILLSAPLAIAATDLALLLVRRDSRLQFVLGIAATINVTIIAGASILGLVGAKFFLFYFVFTVWLIITLVARVMLSAAIFELHRALSTSRGWRTGLASSSGWALRFEGETHSQSSFASARGRSQRTACCSVTSTAFSPFGITPIRAAGRRTSRLPMCPSDCLSLRFGRPRRALHRRFDPRVSRRGARVARCLLRGAPDRVGARGTWPLRRGA